MFPCFRYDLKDRLTAAGIVVALLSVCTVMMPYLQTTIRSNKVFGLGVVCLGIMAVLMLRYTLAGFLLLGYVTACMFLSVSESMGSALYQILCLSGLFLLAIATYDRWRGHKGWTYNAVCLIALTNITVQIIQMCGVSFPRGLIPDAQYGFVGLMGNVNETSALLAVCLPFFFRKRWAWLIPVVVGGLVMARTTNGIIASGIISLVWLFINHRRTAIVAVCYCAIIALAGAYLLTVDRLDIGKQLSGRGLVYKVTAMASTVKPMGWGFGQFDYVVPLLTHTGVIVQKGEKGRAYVGYLLSNVADMKALDRATVMRTGETDPDRIRAYLEDTRNNAPSMFLQAHNEYLEFWFASGYAGLACLLFFVWRSLARGFRKKDKIPVLALIASASTAVFFFVWQIVPIAILTVLCLVLTNAKEVHAS